MKILKNQNLDCNFFFQNNFPKNMQYVKKTLGKSKKNLKIAKNPAKYKSAVGNFQKSGIENFTQKKKFTLEKEGFFVKLLDFEKKNHISTIILCNFV